MIIRSIRKELKENIMLIYLNGTDNMIKRIKIMKNLGIIIDDRLRFKNHCNYMLKKIKFFKIE